MLKFVKILVTYHVFRDFLLVRWLQFCQIYVLSTLDESNSSRDPKEVHNLISTYSVKFSFSSALLFEIVDCVKREMNSNSEKKVKSQLEDLSIGIVFTLLV